MLVFVFCREQIITHTHTTTPYPGGCKVKKLLYLMREKLTQGEMVKKKS